MKAPELPDPGGFPQLDRIIHEPARFLIMKVLSVVKRADFVFLMNQTGMTQGNLSSHMMKLESAGYITVKKEFIERKPHTMYEMTLVGRKAYLQYIDQMRTMLE